MRMRARPTPSTPPEAPPGPVAAPTAAPSEPKRPPPACEAAQLWLKHGGEETYKRQEDVVAAINASRKPRKPVTKQSMQHWLNKYRKSGQAAAFRQQDEEFNTSVRDGSGEVLGAAVATPAPTRPEQTVEDDNVDVRLLWALANIEGSSWELGTVSQGSGAWGSKLRG